jgi:outer membrane protein OmpA-like peptidoglycan-associated protein
MRMSDGVNKLKELLFDTEARRLDELNRRLQLLSETETLRHDDLSKRVDVVFERAGSTERMQASVAAVLDGALRDAEVKQHDSLSKAVAPLVVTTIKYELKNSQDEMVDALYPITGRLVKQYVTAAVNDMMIKINDDMAKKMPGARLVMRLRSLTRGVSMGAIALADAQKLTLDEVFLVRRGTGELVAHWDRLAPSIATSGSMAGRSTAPKSNRGALVPSYLSAMTAFAEEAFDANTASLRTLDMGDARIFVRSSPAYLLAAKCDGRGPAAVESVIDVEFLKLLDTHHSTFANDTPNLTDQAARDKAAAAVKKILPAFATNLDAQLENAHLQSTGPAAIDFTPLYMLATLILVPLLAIGGWFGWQTYLTQKTEVAAQNLLAASPEFNGYPVQLQVERGGRTMTVSGLAPSVEARTVLIQRLGGAAEKLVVRDRLGVLPEGAKSTDLRPVEMSIQRIEANAALAPTRRAIARIEGRIADAKRDIDRIAPLLPTAEKAGLLSGQKRLEDASALLPSIRQLFDRMGNEQVGKTEALAVPLTQLLTVLMAAERAISPSTGGNNVSTAAASDPVLTAEDASFAIERLASTLLAIERTASVKPIEQRVGALASKIDAFRSVDLDSRQRLILWTRANAVFFSNGTDFTDDATVSTMLDELAVLMREASLLVRVAGFTDEQGRSNAAKNNSLALARAEKVIAALVARGVPLDQMVAIGRPSGPDISTSSGLNNRNRRVEFEAGFVGEGTTQR